MTTKNIQIKNWLSDEVMFECPALDDQKPVPLLAEANFDGSNFDGSKFAGANFDGAVFVGSNFTGAKFDNEEADTFTQLVLGLPWVVLLSCHEMQIGCERHTLDELAAFDDRRIADMGGFPAIQFWRKYKTGLLALAEMRKQRDQKAEETQ